MHRYLCVYRVEVACVHRMKRVCTMDYSQTCLHCYQPVPNSPENKMKNKIQEDSKAEQ